MKSVFVSACVYCIPASAVLTGAMILVSSFRHDTSDELPVLEAPMRHVSISQDVPVLAASLRVEYPPAAPSSAGDGGPQFPGIAPGSTPAGAGAPVVPQAARAPVQGAAQPAAGATPQAAVERRTLERALEVAYSLERESAAAFGRGLMNLPDHGDQLQLAVRLQLDVAGFQHDERARDAAFTRHIAGLNAAVEQLQEFLQPNAGGWSADVAYARLLTANAQLTWAEADHDARNMASAAGRSVVLAREHYRLRQADYSQGWATLSQMSHAASFLSPDGRPFDLVGDTDLTKLTAGERDAWSQYHDHLVNAARKTEQLSRRVAGWGHDDRLQLARFEAARASAVLAGISGDRQRALNGFLEADRLAGEVLETRLEFFPKRTAQLHDLSSAWQHRRELHDLMHRAGYDVPEEITQQRQSDLARVAHIALGTRDLRGRNRADVSLVEGLELLEEFEPLSRRETPQSVTDSNSPAPTHDHGT